MILAAVPVLLSPADTPTWRGWDLGDELLVIDNSPGQTWADMATLRGWRYVSMDGRNVGVAGAWNVARDLYLHQTRHALRDGYAEWVERLAAGEHATSILGGVAPPLLLFSASVDWRNGGLRSVVTEGRALADQTHGYLTDLAWHAIGLGPLVLENCGTFDENLWPGYHCDTDYGRRMELLGYHTAERPLPKILLAEEGRATCDDARALRSGAVTPWPDWQGLKHYMEAKWGDVGGGGHLTTPFGKPVPVSWWSPSYRPGLIAVDAL